MERSSHDTKGFRAWYYFRMGWGYYFAFLFAAINTLTVTYFLAIEEYPFLNDLYSNEDSYPYMIKIFDSNELGYKKLKVKVFEIDYEKFNDNSD